MEEWIRSHFDIVAGDWQGDDGQSDAFVVGTQPCLTTASVAAFSANFGETAPASAAQLKAVDPDDAMGWHTHFDEWVAQGILPEKLN